MKKLLIALLTFGVLLIGGCHATPWHEPWDITFPMFLFWLFSVAFYFLPTIIVLARRKKALGPFLVNLLLGWTFIGWVVALIWACLAKE